MRQETQLVPPVPDEGSDTPAIRDPHAGPSHGALPVTPVGRATDPSGFDATVRHHPASTGLVTPQG
eukprot:5461280-Amphidinium_carterae.1